LKIGIKKPLSEQVGYAQGTSKDEEKENQPVGEHRCKTSFKKSFDRMHSKPIIMIRGSEIMRQERIKMEEEIKRGETPMGNI